MWGRVALFYALACAWSWPFFWWRDVHDWRGWPLPEWTQPLVIMWGPGLAALACHALFRGRHRRRATLAGTSAPHALAFAVAPLLLEAIVTPGQTSRLLALVPLALALTLGEELGWRGFLHDELRRAPAWARFVLVGVLWEAWHFTTRTHGRPLARVVLVVGAFALVAVALSWAMGRLVDRTCSVLAAVGVHIQVNVVGDAQTMASLLALGLTLMTWALLLATWPRTAPAAVATAPA